MVVATTGIQRFCPHDGPGIRTVVFFKGCPLRCKWCHNPETQSKHQQILYHESRCITCGACSVCPNDAHTFLEKHIFDRSKCKACGICTNHCPTHALEPTRINMSVDEIIKHIKKDAAFYGENGGLTISGGEPMFQPQQCISLLKTCKEHGIHTAIETCGYFDEKHLPELAKYADLILWDFKISDPTHHKMYTGVSNEVIKRNLLLADNLGIKNILRCIVIRGANTDEAHYSGIAEIFHKLHCCVGVELISYHTYGGSKAMALGRADNGNTDWIPSSADMQHIKAFLQSHGVTIITTRE